MIFHIAKREIYDHLTSLRFALTLVLLVLLMIANAVGHLGQYEARVRDYRQQVDESQDNLRKHTAEMYRLVQNGPGALYKKPSPLAFCGNTSESLLSDYAEGSLTGKQWIAAGKWPNRVWISDTWWLSYPQIREVERNVMPKFTQIDWAFIISVVLSFVAILFTFDAVSGEREHGSLRLAVANPIPRGVFLLGKFVGAFVSIVLPFLVAVLINLFLLSSAQSLSLGGYNWASLAVIVLCAMLYICLFIALGLLVSIRVEQSSMGLMVLVLIWTLFVVLIPNTVGSVSRDVKNYPPRAEFTRHLEHLHQGLYDQLINIELPPVREIPATKATKAWSDYIDQRAYLHDREVEAYISKQIAQIQVSRSLSRISPAATVRYAIESLAGTGLERHLQFMKGARQYGLAFREFLIAADAADSESPHAPGVPQGASQKPVAFDAIPKFEDRATFSGSLNAAIQDILLLALFMVVLFALAYLSFLRIDV